MSEMAGPTNLRRFRKRKAREERERVASANRARHGQTKGERARVALETRRRERLLEGARRTTDPSE
jgi:hypothetical protein